MNVPKSFTPKEKCEYDLKEIDKERNKKIKSIGDLVLDSKEIWKNYKILNLGHIEEEQFKNNHRIIEWYDLNYNMQVIYQSQSGTQRRVLLHALEYISKDILEKRLKDIYEEICKYNNTYVIPAAGRVLIVDKYALILKDLLIQNQGPLNRIENVYRERFGAKRLTQKQKTIIKKYDLVTAHNYIKKNAIKNKEIETWLALE